MSLPKAGTPASYICHFIARLLLVQKKKPFAPHQFPQVKIDFLPVGHTHEDIDQLFARISKGLERTGAESLAGMCCVQLFLAQIHECVFFLNSGLTTAVCKSYSPAPSVLITKHLYNAKDWIEDSIAEVHGHSEPLCFKFELDNNRKAQLSSARWSDAPWKSHGHLLKACVMIANITNTWGKSIDRTRYKASMQACMKCRYTLHHDCLLNITFSN